MLLAAAARRAAAGRLHLRRGRCSNMAAAAFATGDDWRSNVVASRQDALAIAGGARVVAVLGIKTERHQGQPAFDVPLVLQRDGCRIIPVPVYYPDVTEILGEPVVRDLKAVPAAAAAARDGGASSSPVIDILDVFRRSQDVPAHVPDILAMDPRPQVVWLQSGCGNTEAEEALARAGVKVVSDRCLKVDRLEARQLGLVGGGGSKL
jgi:predicted CoA-binding protein